jgi:hypothetical protein
MRQLFAVILFFFASSAQAALTLRYDNQRIPRNITTLGYMDLEIQVLDVLPQRFDANDMLRRLKVFIPHPALTAGGGEVTQQTTYLVLLERQPPFFDIEPETGNYNVVVFIRIMEGTRRFSELIGENNTIPFRAEYDDQVAPDAQRFIGEKVDLERNVAIANEVPDFAVSARHKRLDVTWTPRPQIQYTDGQEQRSGGVVAVAVRSGIGDFAFAGFRLEPDGESDPQGLFCQFTDLENGGDCVSCGEEGSDAKYYIHLEELQKREGVYISESGAQGRGLAISGLEPNETYNIFTFFKPDGALRSQCITASPLINQTMSELNGEPEAEAMDQHCFIATAAFGSALHPSVDRLRLFRDRILLQSKFGRYFVDSYYRHSPPIARVIADSNILKASVRVLLIPVIILAMLSTSFGIWTTAFGLALLMLLTTLVLVKKRAPQRLSFRNMLRRS